MHSRRPSRKRRPVTPAFPIKPLRASANRQSSHFAQSVGRWQPEIASKSWIFAPKPPLSSAVHEIRYATPDPSAGFSNPVPVSGTLASSNIHWPDGVNGDGVRFGVSTTNIKNPTHQQSVLRFDVFTALDGIPEIFTIPYALGVNETQRAVGLHKHAGARKELVP
jgi:hypothetical protein